MRYTIGSMCVLVALVLFPLSASADAGAEQGASHVERRHPEAFVDPEKPALQLELDSAGGVLTPHTPRTVDGYTLEEMNVRVKRARIGVAVSTLVAAVGAVAAGVALVNSICFSSDTQPCPSDRQTRGLAALGATVSVLGLAGVIFSGIRLGKHKRERERLKEANYDRPPRVQWNPAQSRFVF